jgi:hypothetical protein
MPLTLDVSIWGWQGVGVVWGRVGHVMVSDPSTNTALLSQFPHRLGQASVPKGPNILIPFADTYTLEGGNPDVIFEITISDNMIAAFNPQVQNELARPIWDWDPTPPTQTHCARSAYDALKAGGLNIDPTNQYAIQNGQTNEILPNSLWSLLETAGYQPISQNSPNLDLQTINDNEKAVAFARRENLWTSPAALTSSAIVPRLVLPQTRTLIQKPAAVQPAKSKPRKRK